MDDLTPYSGEPGGAIGAAVAWLQGVLLGTVATSIAIIAIASLGFMMLSGRIEMRRVGEVILGCFIIFGAASIASGIRSLSWQLAAAPHVPPPPIYQAAPAPVPPAAPPSAYDPYAGASVGAR
ncbi:MAG TPA: TrbC/VirB2 family protein [Allosphingosinicella sp.]